MRSLAIVHFYWAAEGVHVQHFRVAIGLFGLAEHRLFDGGGLSSVISIRS
jgi:hypothetical protein